MKTTDIVIIEKNRYFQDALATILNNMPGYSVSGQLGQESNIIEEIRNLNPGIIIMDNSFYSSIFPGNMGKDLIPPETKIIILSEYEDLDIGTQIENGVAGIVFKNNAGDEIINAIAGIRNGNIYISPHFLGNNK